MIREGIKYILNVQPDIEVVGEAANGQLAIEGIRATQPDVVLMDIRMPVLDGIAATREALAINPNLKIVVLTTFDLLDHVVDAIRAGAVGFLLKDAEAVETIEGVRSAARGEAFFRTEHASRAMTQAVRVGVDNAPPLRDPLAESLTDRELDVLQELAYGRKNNEIADTLHVSEGTVKTHIHHILQKLGVEDRTQAVVLALRSGLVK